MDYRLQNLPKTGEHRKPEGEPNPSRQGAKAHAEKIRPSPMTKKMIRRPTPRDMSPLPSLAKKAPPKRSRSKSHSSGSKPTPQNVGDVLKPSKPKKRKWHENLDRGEAVSVADMERPLLKNNRNQLASVKSVVTNKKLDRIVDDVFPKVAKLAIESRKKTMEERKKFWKREFSELASDDFKNLWKEAKAKIADKLSGAINNQNESEDSSIPQPPAQKLRRETSKGAKAPQAVRRDSKTSQGSKFPRRESHSSAPNETAARKKSTGPQEVISLLDSDDEVNDGKPKAVTQKSTVKNEVQSTRPHDKSNNQETEVASRSAQAPENVARRDTRVENEEDEVPSRWSHLCVGPDYRNEEFKIESWDVMETVL